MLHQPLVDGLPLPARSRQPIRHRPLINAEGCHSRLGRTTMREQGDDHHHGFRPGAQPVVDGAFCGGEGFAALPADEPLGLPRMDANIALACLTSGRALQIGAEYGDGVPDESPLLALLGSRPRGSMIGPPFSLQAKLTTV